jgi:hypothetical protein
VFGFGRGNAFATNVVFVPGYRNGSIPFGVWPATNLYAPAAWTSSGALSSDVGMARLDTLDGAEIETMLGSRGIAFNQPASQVFDHFGYPARPNASNAQDGFGDYDGQRLVVCDDASAQVVEDFGDGPSIGSAFCFMQQGSSGGAWVIGSSTRYLNSVVSHGYCQNDPPGLKTTWNPVTRTGRCGITYGPYFGNEEEALYRLAAAPEPRAKKCRQKNKTKRRKCKRKRKRHSLGALPAAATPQGMAEVLERNDEAMREAVAAWKQRAGDPPAGQAPAEVAEPALLLQRKVRFLAKRPKLASRTTALLGSRLAGQIGTFVEAARLLRRLSGPGAGARRSELKVGKPRPLAELVGHYREAQRRIGVGWHYLAAINLVETKFGRVKSNSTAGAQGPMQFIPSTWRIYGGGGDIQDPHDAILAAARLLRDNGAPGDYRRALYHYNPSQLYVGAVSRYAKLIARDPDAIAFLYCWGP